jgi:hypothetical protein
MQETSMEEALLTACFMLVSTLKIEAICSPEASVNYQRITLLYMPVNILLHNHSSQNVKTLLGFAFIIWNRNCDTGELVENTAVS